LRKLLLLTLLLTGCASRHPYMSHPAALGEPYYNSQGDLVENWVPSQLTHGGCVLHTIVTVGHIAWECSKPKDGKVPTGGRWIW
jgi:hypothetical protein